MDVRPGGRWRYVSSAPDRDDVVFYGEYLAVEPPTRFEWTFMFDVDGLGPQGGPETHTFEDVGGGRTRVTSVGHIGSPEAIDAALATGMVKGAIETWDRLEALLAEDLTAGESKRTGPSWPVRFRWRRVLSRRGRVDVGWITNQILTSGASAAVNDRYVA